MANGRTCQNLFRIYWNFNLNRRTLIYENQKFRNKLYTLQEKQKKNHTIKKIQPREKNRKKFSFDSFNFPRAYSGTIKNILSPILEAVVYMYVHFFVFNFSHEIVYKLIFLQSLRNVLGIFAGHEIYSFVFAIFRNIKHHFLLFLHCINCRPRFSGISNNTNLCVASFI